MTVATMEKAYRELTERWRERALLDSCATVLAWDEETYLPRGGVEGRADQQALLARLEHERAADPRVGDLLAQAEAAGSSDELVVTNLRLMRREYDEACRVPATLVEELARITTRAQGAWERARDANATTGYLPLLGRVVELTQAWTDCVRDGRSRYDACLDSWETDLTDAEVVGVLDQMRPSLVALLDQAPAPGAAADDAVLRRPVPLDAQRAISELALRWLGFDLDRGRLDNATHPSTMRIGPGDVRLTTRFTLDRPFEGLLSTMHELGHGLYDQNLADDQFGTPAGEASSLALHESQSRLVENLVGRSHEFWRFALPQLRAVTAAFDDVSVDQIYRALNQVGRSTSRIRADEISYDLHIAIRVELERALIAGDLAVGDLPAAWDDAYARDLIRPDDATTGVLQDGHWAAGMFGYFPTYTLGNVIAAQLYLAADAALPDLAGSIARGELAPLIGWMRDAVHRHGSRYPAREVVVRATGAPPTPTAQLARLAAKYADRARG
jgi:carboxypeptidase Taq